MATVKLRHERKIKLAYWKIVGNWHGQVEPKWPWTIPFAGHASDNSSDNLHSILRTRKPGIVGGIVRYMGTSPFKHGNLLRKAHKLSALIGQQAKVHILDWLTIFKQICCPVSWSLSYAHPIGIGLRQVDRKLDY